MQLTLYVELLTCTMPAVPVQIHSDLSVNGKIVQAQLKTFMACCRRVDPTTNARDFRATISRSLCLVFRGKIDSIRASTASADSPVIVARNVPPLSRLKPASMAEVANLLAQLALYTSDCWRPAVSYPAVRRRRPTQSLQFPVTTFDVATPAIIPAG